MVSSAIDDCGADSVAPCSGRRPHDLSRGWLIEHGAELQLPYDVRHRGRARGEGWRDSHQYFRVFMSSSGFEQDSFEVDHPYGHLLNIRGRPGKQDRVLTLVAVSHRDQSYSRGSENQFFVERYAGHRWRGVLGRGATRSPCCAGRVPPRPVEEGRAGVHQSCPCHPIVRTAVRSLCAYCCDARHIFLGLCARRSEAHLHRAPNRAPEAGSALADRRGPPSRECYNIERASGDLRTVVQNLRDSFRPMRAELRRLGNRRRRADSPCAAAMTFVGSFDETVHLRDARKPHVGGLRIQANPWTTPMSVHP